MSPSDDLSVFDILNIFRRRWFLSRASLLSHVVAAQKAANGKIEWVEFDGPFHSHLVKCACALVPRPVQKVKKVMFCFIFEVLNEEVPKTFFDLPPAKAKKRKERRLSWQQQQGEARDAKRHADTRPAAANGGGKQRVDRLQDPVPTSVALDPGPPPPPAHRKPQNLPAVRGPEKPPPPPPVKPTLPVDSPLCLLILSAPRNSTLYPIGNNPIEGEAWELSDSQTARRELFNRLFKRLGMEYMAINNWEIVDEGWDGDLADPAEEMDVEAALGGAFDSVRSPSPPSTSDAGRKITEDVFRWWEHAKDPVPHPSLPPSRLRHDTSSYFTPPPGLSRLPGGS
jgi:hypothetical protein